MQRSKEDKFFIEEYYVEGNIPIVIEEAWLEKVSFNNRKGLIVTRDAESGNQLVFKIKNDQQEIYSMHNFQRWVMKEKVSGSYIGLHGYGDVHLYMFSWPHGRSVIPDSLAFDFFSKEDGQEIKQGGIVFKRSSLKPASQGKH